MERNLRGVQIVMKKRDLMKKLFNSNEALEYRRPFIVLLLFSLFLACMLANAILSAPPSIKSHEEKIADLVAAETAILILAGPPLGFLFWHSYIFDMNPEHYVIAETTLSEPSPGLWRAMVFTVYFEDYEGNMIKAKTGAFPTNGISANQYEDCCGKRAKIAYHAKKQKLWVLEVLDSE